MTRDNVFTYIEGTAALKMQEGASDRTARIVSFDSIAQSRSVAEKPAVAPSFLSDLKVAVEALGFEDIKRDMRHGSLAGKGLPEPLSPKAYAFCAVAFAVTVLAIVL